MKQKMKKEMPLRQLFEITKDTTERDLKGEKMLAKILKALIYESDFLLEKEEIIKAKRIIDYLELDIQILETRMRLFELNKETLNKGTDIFDIAVGFEEEDDKNDAC